MNRTLLVPYLIKLCPGNPSGDEILYVPEIETQLNIVATTSHPSEKSLEYKSVVPSGIISGHSGWLSFRAQSTNFVRPITFIWTAQKNFSSGGPHLYIDCSDGSGVVAARIRILNNGHVVLVNNIATDAGDDVGVIQNNENHTFMVTVDLPNNKYNISVLKGSGNITENGHALLTSNVASYHNPANPSVSFKYDPFGSNQKYVIDEVFINRKN